MAEYDEAFPHPDSPEGRAWRKRCEDAGQPDPYRDDHDIEWILEEAINARSMSADNNTYFIQSQETGKTCVISFSETGERMLFDGRDIETESFMGYVGLIEAIDEGQTYFERER